MSLPQFKVIKPYDPFAPKPPIPFIPPPPDGMEFAPVASYRNSPVTSAIVQVALKWLGASESAKMAHFGEQACHLTYEQGERWITVWITEAGKRPIIRIDRQTDKLLTSKGTHDENVSGRPLTTWIQEWKEDVKKHGKLSL